MIIGQNNNVSQTLAETIGHFVQADFIVINDEFEKQLKETKTEPQFVFVNLMDVNQPQLVSETVRQYFPDSTQVGIHSFQNQALIDQTLAQGYDHYLTVFTLADTLPTLLRRATKSK